MRKQTCPGCGAGFNGKRCRSCGYVPFGEAASTRTRSDRARPSAPKKAGKKHPLIRFFLLLYLIYSLMPLLRNWGMELERTEDRNTAASRETAVSAEDTVTLYRQEDLQIFISGRDTEPLTGRLTLYAQNDTSRDLELRITQLLVNGCPLQQELVWSAGANAIGKAWLTVSEESLHAAGISHIRSIAFRLEIRESSGNLLYTTQFITVGDTAPSEEETVHG